MTPDPITPVHEDERGRVFTADSMTYFDERIGADDIAVCGSYAAPSSFRWALRLGVRGIVAHAVGVGKDEAGISGLPLADEHGVPAAACETMSARIADGASVWAGTIGHANETAQKLGVEAGQSIAEAARLMLGAPPGKKIVLETSADKKIYDLEETENGNIRASWGLPVLRSIKEPRPRDVFIQGSHCGQTLTHVIPLRLRGIIANDAGRGMDDSGIASFAPLAEAGIAAAAVGAMSARIGDVMSTWNDGVISVMNEVAKERGVRAGMTTKEAARIML
ncbi:MAG: hypothetical protein V3V56_04255 [bacterium]